MAKKLILLSLFLIAIPFVVACWTDSECGTRACVPGKCVGVIGSQPTGDWWGLDALWSGTEGTCQYSGQKIAGCCTEDSDCADSNACTKDQCWFSKCENKPITTCWSRGDGCCPKPNDRYCRSNDPDCPPLPTVGTTTKPQVTTVDPDPFCGDGYVNQPEEECDDGHLSLSTSLRYGQKKCPANQYCTFECKCKPIPVVEEGPFKFDSEISFDPEPVPPNTDASTDATADASLQSQTQYRTFSTGQAYKGAPKTIAVVAIFFILVIVWLTWRRTR